VAKEPTHTGHTLLYTWLQRDELRTQFLAQMRVFSVLVCPVAAIPAFRHGERSWQVEGQEVKYLDAWSYTEWFQSAGISGVRGSGDPVGGGVADWSADRGAALGRGSRAASGGGD